MKKLLIAVGMIIISIAFYSGCKDERSNIVSTTELSATNESGAFIKVSIKSNGGPLKTFKLYAIDWDLGQNIERDKFYRVPSDKQDAFMAKLTELNGDMTVSKKSKASSVNLAVNDHAPGLNANATTVCFANSSFGNCETEADAYYYNLKTHVQHYWNPWDNYYYSHVDSFSVWSDIFTEFNSNHPTLHCEATVTRNDFYYKVYGIFPGRIYLAASPPTKKDSLTNPPNPPYYADTLFLGWLPIGANNVDAKDYCGQ
jgi:hypothetical protein